MRKPHYTGHLGGMDYHWKNPPPPFNPVFDPKARDRYDRVTQSMVDDDFYANHTRQECKDEWARRYELEKEKDNAGNHHHTD